MLRKRGTAWRQVFNQCAPRFGVKRCQFWTKRCCPSSAKACLYFYAGKPSSCRSLLPRYSAIFCQALLVVTRLPHELARQVSNEIKASFRVYERKCSLLLLVYSLGKCICPCLIAVLHCTCEGFPLFETQFVKAGGKEKKKSKKNPSPFERSFIMCTACS